MISRVGHLGNSTSLSLSQMRLENSKAGRKGNLNIATEVYIVSDKKIVTLEPST